jgi:hypothetical protein
VTRLALVAIAGLVLSIVPTVAWFAPLAIAPTCDPSVDVVVDTPAGPTCEARLA